MAQILGRFGPPRFWPVDKVILAYFAAMCAVEAIWFSRIPEASWLIALHFAGAVLIVASACSAGSKQVPSASATLLARFNWFFRHWYPILFVACCYREMAILIERLVHARFDQKLADLDFTFWHAYPSVWLERLYHPILTEYLQIIYTLFVPVVLFVPWLVWRQKRYREFRYMSFLLALGFLASYLGYPLVPARGPRYFLEHLQHVPLHGLWGFDSMQATLNRLEKEHYDCFTSGHTELTVLACWLSRSLSKRFFSMYFLYTLSIVFATVYLRYHYTVDLLAGVVVAVVLILAAPAVYRGLSEKGDSIGD